MPRFSIVIPTLQRSDTLRHALAGAIAQTYDDVEIVVQNNGRDAATEALVQELDNRQIRHFWSKSVLTMTENWEAALANASGDLITFIGDDDSVFHGACRTAAEVFDRAEVEILSWQPFCYYWPTYIHSEQRNLLVALVDYSPHLEIVSSDDELRRFYRFAIHYSQLPMIYNSFVRRRVIERIKSEMGCYFVGKAPDVSSGIANAAYCERFARLSIPLSMTGISHHSTGHNTHLAERGLVSSNQMERDFGAMIADDRLVPSDDLPMFIAAEMLLLQNRLPSLRGRVEFDFYRLVQSVAAAINDRPGAYEDTLTAIHQLAERHGIDLSNIAIPARLRERSMPKFGATMVGRNRVQFAIDGNAISLATIADAIGLMQQIMTPVDGATIEIRNSRVADYERARPGDTLVFGVDGNGLPALVDGWGEPEEWGTWSVAKRASMSFSLQAPTAQSIRADLRYRAFISTAHPHLMVSCCIAGQEVAAWGCSDARPSRVQELTIPAALIPSYGAVNLELKVSDPRSPAELGLSSDARLLGIGIEAVSFRA